jgi:hypothetical protein
VNSVRQTGQEHCPASYLPPILVGGAARPGRVSRLALAGKLPSLLSLPVVEQAAHAGIVPA